MIGDGAPMIYAYGMQIVGLTRGAIPAATYRCRCGIEWNATGRERVQALGHAANEHRKVCDLSMGPLETRWKKRVEARAARAKTARKTRPKGTDPTPGQTSLI